MPAVENAIGFKDGRLQPMAAVNLFEPKARIGVFTGDNTKLFESDTVKFNVLQTGKPSISLCDKNGTCASVHVDAANNLYGVSAMKNGTMKNGTQSSIHAAVSTPNGGGWFPGFSFGFNFSLG